MLTAMIITSKKNIQKKTWFWNLSS
jgi:hypothetical protein